MPEHMPIRVLAIGAHPSDVFPLAGGTLAKHAKRGDQVILLALTDGIEHHTERYVGRPHEEIAAILRKQSTEAARVLGISDCRYLDLGDMPLVSSRENLTTLADTIQDIRPDIIISAHYPFREIQRASDHAEAARMVERASMLIGRRHTGKEPHRLKSLWFSAIDYIMWSQPVPRVPDTFVDIGETIEQKIQACITTWDLPPERQQVYAENSRAFHRTYGARFGIGYAEPFEMAGPRQVAVQYLE